MVVALFHLDRKQAMRSKLRKTLWISLSLASVCGILLALTVCYFHLELTLRVLLAQEQVQVFSAMCEQAHRGDTQQAMGCLEYVVNYYPSGTKQVQGSTLDDIVETSRKLAIENIITVLRQKSGKDLGSDPKVWLQNRRMVGYEKGGGQTR
jgi:hypothetical protein